ncbi:hypothetical protein [Streptomyces zhihengii]|uniref:hypothetical protein n=1 Tax=Streptomyces zhihengii TaxID=1818004 RepID=UPI00360AD2DB
MWNPAADSAVLVQGRTGRNDRWPVAVAQGRGGSSRLPELLASRSRFIECGVVVTREGGHGGVSASTPNALKA